MAQGVYGTSIPANINPQKDVEIWFNYKASRSDDSYDSNTYSQLESNCLVKATDNDNSPIEGMYSLKLPMGKFSKRGYYSVYIKPKELETEIVDIAPLSSFNDVKGIILKNDKNVNIDLASLLGQDNSLVGYRLVFVENNGTTSDDVRIITSSNRCEPMVQTTGAKTTVYRYNANSDFVFLTVTPSTAPSFKANATPYIGKVGQKIRLINTKFDPIHLDIEMVENDADTLATMIMGDQLRSLDEGLITTFNSDKEIFKQQEIYSLKDSATGRPIYEVRKLRDNVDSSQQLPE